MRLWTVCRTKVKFIPSGNPVTGSDKHFTHLPASRKCDIMGKKGKELSIMLFAKKNVRYVTLSDSELRLAKYALLQFRNALIAKGLPTEDVNTLLLKLYK